MPKGCFVILLPRDSDYKVLGYYFKGEKLNFKITSDLFLRLNLDHSKNEYSLLRLKNFVIVSFFHKFKGKISQKASGIIIGLLLNEADESEEFRIQLRNSAVAIESINFLEKSKEDFETKLMKIYKENLETLYDLLDTNTLKKKIINRTKEMLSGDKKERKIAHDLLEKIEEKVHIKLSNSYKSAENALKSLDYDKAEKFFNKAAEIADDLLEKDLAKPLRDKAALSKLIPSKIRELDNLVQTARGALKKEEFHSAYLHFKKASEIAKELIMSEKEEEYRLKSKALQDFYQVDQRFKKKK